MTERLSAEGLRGRQGFPFEASAALMEAANVALALEMPLLLTGDPGCGKTDFAFAAARQLAGNRPNWDPDHTEQGLLQAYIRSDTSAKDLLYHYDAVRRFGQAHHGDEDERRDARDARRFIDLRPLGRALSSPTRRVLLLDEIDKAPRDLPNDLLRELDQGMFSIPEIAVDADVRYGPDSRLPKREMGIRKTAYNAAYKPLIIVTSNQERQLPSAFLRRCAFCHLEFPNEVALGKIIEGRFRRSTDASRVVAAHPKLRGVEKRSRTYEKAGDLGIDRVGACFAGSAAGRTTCECSRL